MGISTARAQAYLTHEFFDTIGNYDADTDQTIALHTASPGVGGTQQTNETTYTGYARETVSKSAAGWTLTGTEIVNDNDIEFAECTAGATQTIKYITLGRGSGGSHEIGYIIELDPADWIDISQNIVPRIPAGLISVNIGASVG